jgi:hypothetical protein
MRSILCPSVATVHPCAALLSQLLMAFLEISEQQIRSLDLASLQPWTGLGADAEYPWLPLLLERSSGQLTRHGAMLLPHQFSRTEGIRFAPEALELWITHRLFGLDAWARQNGLSIRQGLAQMAAVLGFELDASFWNHLPPA